MNSAQGNPRSDAPPGFRARPSIITAFSGYEPSFNMVKMSQRIVDSVPEEYLQGLTEIVLTNTGALSRERRRSVTKARGRKVRIKEARGLYHPASQQRGAWIEIFVDKTLTGWGNSWLGRTRWVCEAELSDLLFHEIGHHIHFTVRPEYREKEDVADAWKVRLQRNYIQQHYRLIRSLIRFLNLGAFVDSWSAKTSAKMLAKGAISRAEHEENVRRKGLNHS